MAIEVLLAMIAVLLLMCQDETRSLTLPSRKNEDLLRPYQAAGVVLGAAPQLRCSILLLTNVIDSHSLDSIDLGQLVTPWGVALLEVAVDGQDANETQAQLSRVVDAARRVGHSHITTEAVGHSRITSMAGKSLVLLLRRVGHSYVVIAVLVSH
ncbi:uncharacterized protein LOC121873918 [Homarus americanus]|uniref:uncharacterized protein LOC121873918 n=1 Tax=Homarus americanus TaxID=6706 RepID=UPI001C4903DC|nr:uncharacterized protein LOC121873918 [Homarus americanus]